MTGANVVVVGSINVDLCTFVDRLPRPGETVIGGAFERVHGGKGANQAVAAARLGANVTMVGMVGSDDLGDAARSALAEEGVEVGSIGVGERHTGVAEILIDAQAENLIAVASGANDELTEDAVKAAMGRIDRDDAVVTSVLEIPIGAVAAAAAVAEERGWRFILNPAPAKAVPDDVLARCDVVTPNEHELAGLGKSSAEEVLAAGARAVVVTRGASGADLFLPHTAPSHLPAFTVDPLDTTGAGDAFTGALAWALAEGHELTAAVRMASAAAALSTTARGARTGMPSRAQLEGLLASPG